MKYVYLLEHAYEYGENEEVKLLGVYSSRKKAEEAVDRYFELPGFKDHPRQCFCISKLAINEDTGFSEGFISWQEANG